MRQEKSRPAGNRAADDPQQDQHQPKTSNGLYVPDLDPVICRVNHLDSALLGTVKAGTLRLDIDGRGLHYEVDLPNTSAGNDVAELVGRGDVTNSSFSFICFQDTWSVDADGTPLRTLVSVRLVDCAPVTSPAYSSTDCALRSLARSVGAPIEDVEEYAARGQLRKFLTRSDIDGGRPLSGRQAQLAILAKRWPAQNVVPRPLSGRQAQVRMLEKRWPAQSVAPQPMSGRQAQVHILAKRWGPQ